MFEEHYHSTKDGALKESLLKHVKPAFELKKNKKELHILDICFGLGLNTLSTLYHYAKNAPQTKLHLYSPEFDEALVKALVQFRYPPQLEYLKPIIQRLSKDRFYHDKNFTIELFLGDAREYVKRFKNRFDIVYQDAFSPACNPLLWTQEYFSDIKNALRPEGILTTYSTALKTRLALYENGFFIYLLRHENARNSTLASLQPLEGLEKVDMAHKIACNPHAKPLKDTQVAQKVRF